MVGEFKKAQLTYGKLGLAGEKSFHLLRDKNPVTASAISQELKASVGFTPQVMRIESTLFDMGPSLTTKPMVGTSSARAAASWATASL